MKGKCAIETRINIRVSGPVYLLLHSLRIATGWRSRRYFRRDDSRQMALSISGMTHMNSLAGHGASMEGIEDRWDVQVTLNAGLHFQHEMRGCSSDAWQTTVTLRPPPTHLPSTLDSDHSRYTYRIEAFDWCTLVRSYNPQRSSLVSTRLNKNSCSTAW